MTPDEMRARVDRVDGVAYRRLRLASEASGTAGFIVRPAKAVREPSWAATRLLVSPRPSLDGSPQFRLELTSGVRRGRVANVTIDAATGAVREDVPEPRPVPVAPRVAPAATHRLRIRA